MNPFDSPRLDRRAAIKWMAAASSMMLARGLSAAESGASQVPAPVDPASGYGGDPDLVKDYKPGDLWPLTFTEAQRRAAAALSATIIPSIDGAPGAAELSVQDFIDEWISAPYPDQAKDRPIILEGLAWIDGEAQRRWERVFADATDAQRIELVDPISHVGRASMEHKSAARFFARFRDLTAGGYYSTPDGWRAIGYVGNMPSLTFDGPPPELLKRLGLT